MYSNVFQKYLKMIKFSCKMSTFIQKNFQTFFFKFSENYIQMNPNSKLMLFSPSIFPRIKLLTQLLQFIVWQIDAEFLHDIPELLTAHESRAVRIQIDEFPA